MKWFTKVLIEQKTRNAAASLSLFIAVQLYCSILFKLVLPLWLFYGRFKRRGRKKKKTKRNWGRRKRKTRMRGTGREGECGEEESSAGYSD